MTPFKRILIPTDGSENAKVAASKGLELAKSINAEVTAMSVVDMGTMAYASQGFNSMAPVYSFLEESAKSAVDLVRAEGEERGIDVKTIVGKGVPANAIIEESKDYDLIVMGTMGRTGLPHLLLGSVAEKVVRLAHCPVLVIRINADLFDE